MKKYEKEEIRDLPDKYKPVGAWRYWGYQILFAIPLIGQIFLIIFALNGNNVNRRSFARSYFCWLIICLVIFGAIMLLGAGTGLLTGIIQKLQGIMQGAGQ